MRSDALVRCKITPVAPLVSSAASTFGWESLACFGQPVVLVQLHRKWVAVYPKAIFTYYRIYNFGERVFAVNILVLWVCNPHRGRISTDLSVSYVGRVERCSVCAVLLLEEIVRFNIVKIK